MLVGVGFIAEGTTPGHFLYSYKTGVNEKVKGWLLFSGTSKVSYQVDLLEKRLAEIDDLVSSGKLTPEAAMVAREQLVSQLETTNSYIAATQNAGLSDEEKAELNEQLERVKQALLSHKNRLALVENTATKKPQLNARGSTRPKTIVLAVAETTDLVETVAENIIETGSDLVTIATDTDISSSDSESNSDETETVVTEYTDDANTDGPEDISVETDPTDTDIIEEVENNDSENATDPETTEQPDDNTTNTQS